MPEEHMYCDVRQIIGVSLLSHKAYIGFIASYSTSDGIFFFARSRAL